MMLSLLKNWRYIVIAVLALLCATQELRIRACRVELQKERHKLAQCEEANLSNVATIKGLTEENKKVHRQYAARLKGKDKVIVRIKEIDGIAPAVTTCEDKGGTDEATDSAAADPLLDELNRMFPESSNSKD